MDINPLVDAVGAALVTFSDSNRLYALEGAAPLDQLHVERWSGEESLSRCYRWQIDAFGTDAGLSLEAMLGQCCGLRTILADGGGCVRSGLVCEARLLGADGGLARYRLTLVPWLWVLSQGWHSRVFQGRSVLDIVEAVFADYPAHATWTITPDARSLIAEVRPRSYAVQYRESDLAFVERLLAEEGLGYAFVEDAEALCGHTLTIFGDAGALPEDASSASGGGIRFHRAAAVEASDTLQALSSGARLGQGAVTRLSTDYKAQAATAASAQVGCGGREEYDVAGPYAFADSREGEHYARLQAEAHEGRNRKWLGRGTVRTARAGTRFRVRDLPARPGSQPEGYVWTQVVHAGVNNLPEALQATSQSRRGAARAGMEAALWKQAEATGYANRFEALDQGQPYRPVLKDGTGLRLNPRPTTPGPQTAIVVGPEGETAPGASGPLYTDKLGRLKVRFHWMAEGASCWLRSVQRYAGSGHGSQFLARIGDEVLVDFLEGDIDRPVIVGSVYNGQGEAGIGPTPGAGEAAVSGEAYTRAGDFRASAQGNLAGGHSPAWHGQSGAQTGHANAAALSGIKTQGFDGSGSNQLVMDDTDHQGRVQMASTQAASQLNLGHLIHQADNYRGSFRGAGFELRTDGYGAIRGQRGVLLSTYTITPTEPAADVTAAVALLKQHAQMARVMSEAAKTHEGVPLAGHAGVEQANRCNLSVKAAPIQATLDSLNASTEGSDYAKADPQPGGGGDVPHSVDALTTLAGRGGIAAIAGQTLHVAAGETLNLASGGHGNLAVANQLRLHANQAIGLLAGARKAEGTGLGLIAGKQPLEVQAQHDTLRLRSRDDLQVVSANASVEFAAKQVIHLANSQGAFIHLEGGNITFGCPGKLTVHAGNHKLEGPTHLSREMNQWGEPKFDQKVQLKLPGGTPAKNYRYEYVRDDGAKIAGVTDGDGWATVQKDTGTNSLGIHLLGKAHGGGT